MDKMSMIVSIVMLVAMIVMYAPGVILSNRGKMLRNIALWLAIFVAAGLFYKNFGPGSPHPLFSAPVVVPTAKTAK
jgi:membrane associated rhomboid family serine protease